MINRVTVLLTFFAIATSFYIWRCVYIAPPALPLTIFTLACTVLLAALALPSLLSISESKIVKGLFFIFYKDPMHYLFPFFQVVLAAFSLIAEFSKVNGDFATPVSKLMLVFMVLNIVFIFTYLRYLIRLIGTPALMLANFEERVVRKIKKGKDDDAVDAINMLGEIANNTGAGKEKSEAVETFGRLLEIVTRPPNTGER